MARPDLIKHPKFARLARTLGSKTLAMGVLELMWQVAYANGDPVIGDAVSVALSAEWDGDPAELVSALADAGKPYKVGFIEPVPGEEGNWKVHDLFDHAPGYVRRRCQREQERRVTGRRIENLRRDDDRSVTRQRPVTDEPVDNQSTDDDEPLTIPPAPAPAHKDERPEPQAASSPADRSTDLGEGDVIVEIMITGREIDGERPVARCRKSFVDDLQADYEGVEIVDALKHMKQYWAKSPEKRKTPRGIARAIVGWVQRSIARNQYPRRLYDDHGQPHDTNERRPEDRNQFPEPDPDEEIPDFLRPKK